MRAYFASPRTQQQFEHLADLPTLLSFATWAPWMARGYVSSASSLLIDSGAFSELNSGVKIDIDAYVDWKDQFVQSHVDAWAALDDIGGDWRRSMRQLKSHKGFPTYHDTDPPELLPELIAYAREDQGWLGIGLKPPRHGREAWLHRTLEQIPDGIHVHGWALRKYSYEQRLDSVDSTQWLFSAMRVRQQLGDWLTYGEAIDLELKRIRRTPRVPHFNPDKRDQVELELRGESETEVGPGGLNGLVPQHLLRDEGR